MPTRIALTDRYEGRGTASNGGGARCGIIDGVQINGIGRNPLAGIEESYWHSYGGARLDECIADALWTEIVNQVLPTRAPVCNATLKLRENGKLLRPFQLKGFYSRIQKRRLSSILVYNPRFDNLRMINQNNARIKKKKLRFAAVDDTLHCQEKVLMQIRNEGPSLRPEAARFSRIMSMNPAGLLDGVLTALLFGILVQAIGIVTTLALAELGLPITPIERADNGAVLFPMPIQVFSMLIAAPAVETIVAYLGICAASTKHGSALLLVRVALTSVFVALLHSGTIGKVAAGAGFLVMNTLLMVLNARRGKVYALLAVSGVHSVANASGLVLVLIDNFLQELK